MDYYGPMVPFFRFLAASLVIVLTVGAKPSWAQFSVVPENTSQNGTAASDALLDAALFYEILLGEIVTRGGDPATGYSLMLEAARSSNDEGLYKRAVDIALQSRSGEPALAAAQAWAAAKPRSIDAHRYALQILVALNRVDDSAGPLQQILDLQKPEDRATFLPALPTLYARVSDKALAASVAEKALQSSLADPVVSTTAWTVLGRMRLMANDKQGALEAARKAQDLAPLDDKPAALALELLEAGTTEAEPLLRRYLEGKPSPEIRMVYARQLLEWQRYTEARQQLDLVTTEKPDLPQAWMALAALQFQDSDLDNAETSLQKYSTLVEPGNSATINRTNMTSAYLLRAQIAEKRGDYAAAEQWLSRIENAQDLFSAQTRRASLLARQGKLAEARALIRSIPADTDEARRMNLMAEVQLLRDVHKYREAYALQKKLVEQSPEDDDLTYELAMLADKNGDHAAMERLLRQIIARKPDYHHAYNALGYSLADRGIRLTEAKELVLKALTYAPKDPFITDSLAWVEFRMGNPAEALRLLETAFAIRPDADLAAHLGEVLWALGHQERAKTIWKESQRLNPDNETLRETLKRLHIKL
ncbi:Flp pilus assembly protein TadD [Simplicispira sp. 125]|nr:Flp pilus assembly protein TadD [Simplicispira sp. 125]REG15855.1 Flp pilus assembly protein TadD [Simplicispira sp. 110]